MRMELGLPSGGGAASERERGDGALDRRVPVLGAGEGVRSGVWICTSFASCGPCEVRGPWPCHTQSPCRCQKMHQCV